ncbi:MAG: flagellar hook assembly protein FlgD [Thiobacillus sp.]|nr:flagellar hook assembly protein FlgD [Thiobacillus sp.]
MTAATQTDYSSLIASLNTTKSTATSSVQEIGDRFLKLLVTQLKNQDPMNPMDNADMTMQLAQMSTVEGINKLNTSMEGLLSSYQSAQTMQATGLIGHQVLTEGNLMTLSSGQALGAANLAAAADEVTVTVLDSSGKVVDTLELGAQKAGQLGFAWDGLDTAGNVMADGSYRFTVSAKSDGELVTTTPLALTTVGSVRIENGTVSLDLSGIGQRTLDKVTQIF